jgi:hypothetical protein
MEIVDDPFVKYAGWQQFTWTERPPDDSDLYRLFTGGATLLIGIDSSAPESRSYILAWLDEGGQWKSITGLKPGQTTRGLVAQLGSYTLTLFSNGTRLTGTIYSPSFSTGTVGIFAAETNPVQEGCEAYESSPGWRRWFRRPARAIRSEPRVGERIAVG